MITIKLKLPKTIRMLEIDTYKSEKYKALTLKAEKNNIVEGYTLSQNTSETSPHKFYAEINIDNDKLWSLFKSLMMDMHEHQSLITAFKDDEVEDAKYSAYQDKYALYNKIEKYAAQLAVDGFLQFGTIHQTDIHCEEVFVHYAKYIQFWGMNEDRFREIMNSYSLYEVKDLEFIDSYPMAVTTPCQFDKDALSSTDLLIRLRTEESTT